jgi:hypothetical protein
LSLIFLNQLVGLQDELKNGIETVWPKWYRLIPTEPMAFNMDTLCITRYAIPFCVHRSNKSACVVALMVIL